MGRVRWILVVLGVSASFLGAGRSASAQSQPAVDVERGRQVFKLCEGCHSVQPGEHRYGPSLAGLFQRPAGRLKGYEFSEPLRAARFRWDQAHLTQWLADEPKNMVPGTRMEFPGLPDKEELSALVAYLSTLRTRK